MNTVALMGTLVTNGKVYLRKDNVKSPSNMVLFAIQVKSVREKYHTESPKDGIVYCACFQSQCNETLLKTGNVVFVQGSLTCRVFLDEEGQWYKGLGVWATNVTIYERKENEDDN